MDVVLNFFTSSRLGRKEEPGSLPCRKEETDDDDRRDDAGRIGDGDEPERMDDDVGKNGVL